MKISNGQIYFMLSVIVIGVLVILFTKPPKSISCENQKQLYVDKIDSGIILNKFIDTSDHASKTVVIKASETTYTVDFVPYDNWNDFEKIRINDRITKPAQSFVFTINSDYQFEFMLECDYELKSK